MGETTRCPDCSRPMIWGGSRSNALVCTECTKPKSFSFDGMAVSKDESITDLKNRGICYCHLMTGRTCQVCRSKGAKA